MQSIEDDIKLISEVWGSEDALRSVLQSEVRRLCRLVCGPKSKSPAIDLRPSLMSNGVLPSNSGLRSAEYEPANGGEATIILFPSACTDKGILTVAIAHELIHHWELTVPPKRRAQEYPQAAEELIRSAFKDRTKERIWRSGHSAKFVSKAVDIARKLEISLLRMLVHRGP